IMDAISKILIALVALEHFYILYLEMFLWTKPAGLRTFGMTQDVANASQTLAANQGLYNGFLATGLVWSLLHPNADTGRQLGFFFLACVIVAALYGAWTVKPRIFWVQGLPAVLAF